MKLGCVVVAHRAPEQVRLMLQTLAHEDVAIYLHVDGQSDPKPFAVDRVTLLPRRTTPWGGPEIIDAILDGIAQAVADGCSYLTILTGHGFPLRPVDKILDFFGEYPMRSYGEFRTLCDRRRTEFYAYTVRGRRELCIPLGEDTSAFGSKGKALNWMLRMRGLPRGKREFPTYLSPFAGRVWWDLSREAAEYVLRFVAEHPGYRRYHEHTWCPDEVFFCSILGSSGLDIMNRGLRYYTWGDDARSLTATTQDIPAMLSSGALFAQKVDGATAAELARRLVHSSQSLFTPDPTPSSRR